MSVFSEVQTVGIRQWIVFQWTGLVMLCRHHSCILIRSHSERERRLPLLPPAASDQYRTLIMQAHIPSQLLMWEELVENAHPSSFCSVLSAWWL